MNIEITGIHLDITPAIKERAEKKFNKLMTFDSKISRIHVVLRLEGHEHNARATIHTIGSNFHAEASSKDMYKTIDLLYDKLINQLKNHK